MRSTFRPNLNEVATRVCGTMAGCSLKPLTAEAPYHGPLLMQRYRHENWPFARLWSHCILGNQRKSLQLKPTAKGALRARSGWASVQELAEKRSQKLEQLVPGFKPQLRKPP